jgi:DNA polymerase I-like protein with 3'-5' exonuclease and polymerase domains
LSWTKQKHKALTSEIPLVKVLADMEKRIRLDVPFLKSLSQELDKDIKTLEATIAEIAGEIQFSFKTIEYLIW